MIFNEQHPFVCFTKKFLRLLVEATRHDSKLKELCFSKQQQRNFEPRNFEATFLPIPFSQNYVDKSTIEAVQCCIGMHIGHLYNFVRNDNILSSEMWGFCDKNTCQFEKCRLVIVFRTLLINGLLCTQSVVNMMIYGINNPFSIPKNI